MDEFNGMIRDANLLKINYKGLWFSWGNMQYGKDLILPEIDCGFCNQALLDCCDKAWVEIISSSISEHMLLCLHLKVELPKRRVPFRHINA